MRRKEDGKAEIGRAKRWARALKRTLRNGHKARWFVVRVRAGEEFRAEEILAKNGYGCFVPFEKKWRRRSRYQCAPELVRRPLLIRYMFVGFSADPIDWYRLASFPFVEKIVGVGGYPLQVPWSHVADFVVLYNQDGRTAPREQKYMKANREFGVGDRVEVFGGPFDGSVLRVEEIRGSKAKVLVDMLGSERAVTIPVDKLAAA